MSCFLIVLLFSDGCVSRRVGEITPDEKKLAEAAIPEQHQ